MKQIIIAELLKDKDKCPINIPRITSELFCELGISCFFISADFVRNKLFSTNAIMNNVNASNKEYVILFSTTHNKLEYSKIKTGLAFKLSDFVLKNGVFVFQNSIASLKQCRSSHSGFYPLIK